MTINDLKSRYLGCLPSGYGHWKIKFSYRGQTVETVTNNSLAIDRINFKDECPERKVKGFYTLKQAYEMLYKEAKGAYRNKNTRYL